MDKGEGETGRVELVEADTESDTDAEVGIAGLLVELEETDVADTGGFRAGVVLVVTCGGTITLVAAGTKVG
jgi:hypothetical protein